VGRAARLIKDALSVLVQGDSTQSSAGTKIGRDLPTLTAALEGEVCAAPTTISIPSWQDTDLSVTLDRRQRSYRTSPFLSTASIFKLNK
jgi:hypothetical protein